MRPSVVSSEPSQVRSQSTDCGLKDVLADLIPEKQKEVKEFRAQHGNFVVGEVTVDMVSWKLTWTGWLCVCMYVQDRVEILYEGPVVCVNGCLGYEDCRTLWALNCLLMYCCVMCTCDTCARLKDSHIHMYMFIRQEHFLLV